jgi:hypothetical protein
MSELAVIQQSRFQEILKEELEAIKKQLTESQINLLCGPSVSVNVALSEIGAGRDVSFTPSQDMSAHRQRASDAQEEMSFDVSLDQAREHAHIAFGRIQDINDPKDWEIQNALTVIIFNVWDDSVHGNSTWNDLKHAKQFYLSQFLRTIDLPQPPNRLINAWDITRPFVRFAGEKLADDTGLTALRDFVADSAVFNIIAGLLVGAGLIGSTVAVVVSAPAWIPAAAGTAMTVGTAMLVAKGMAEISKGDTKDGLTTIITALIMKWTQVATVPAARAIAIAYISKTGAAIVKGGAAATWATRAWQALRTFYQYAIVGLGIGEGVMGTFGPNGPRADFPLRWNYTSNCNGEDAKKRWGPLAHLSTQSLEDAEWIECSQDSLTAEDNEEMQQLVSGGAVTINDDSIDVENTPFAARANELIANSPFGRADPVLPDLDVDAVLGAFDSVAPTGSIQERKSINHNLMLFEARFQKLAGI